MASSVVFKGISNPAQVKQQIEKIDNSELNNYQDVGVKYSGFSKVKQQGNTYKLLRQETWLKVVAFGWTASNSRLTLSFASADDLSKYNFYITSIVIFTHTDTDCSFYIDDYSTNDNYLYFNAEHEQFNSANFDFSANPLKIVGGTFSIQPTTIIGPSAAVSITGKVRLNFYGFREQKP